MQLYGSEKNTPAHILALSAALSITPSLLYLGSMVGERVSLIAIVIIHVSLAVTMLGKHFKIILICISNGVRFPSTAAFSFAVIMAYSLLTFFSLWLAPYEAGDYPKYVLMPTLALYTINILIFSAIRPSVEWVSVCIRAVFISAPIFAVLTLVFDAYLGNVPNFISSMLSGDRVTSTAFFGGANSSAIFHGFSLVCSMGLLFRRFSYFCMIAASVSAFYLLIGQSKGMIAASALCIACLFFRPLFSRIAAIALLAIWPISSLVLLSFYRGISDSQLGDILSRSEGAEYGVATGRPMIWEAAWHIIERNSDLFWFGLGFSSASRTELVVPLAFLFNSDSAADITMRGHGLHNAALQINFDMGVVGLAMHFFLLCALLIVMVKSNFTWALPAFVYFIASGFNEAVGTYYQPLVYIPFLGMLVLFLKLYDAEKTQGEPSPRKLIHRRDSRSDRKKA